MSDLYNDAKPAESNEPLGRFHPPSLQKLIDNAPIGILWVSLEGQLLYANDALAHMLEYDSPEQLIGTSALKIYKHSQDRQTLIDLLHQKNVVHDFETILLTRTGQERIVLGNLTLDGNIVNSMLVDITAHKQEEAQAQATATRLQILADASRIFVEAGTNYQNVLATVVQATAEKIRGGCAIHLLSEDEQWLDLVAFFDIDEAATTLIQALFGQTHVHINEPVDLAHVFRNRKALLVPTYDLSRLRETASKEDALLADQITELSLIKVPVSIHGQIIGVLSLFCHGINRPAFNELDLNLVQNLADRAALAISNARLFEQAQHELAVRKRVEEHVVYQASLLQNISDAVIATDLDFNITSWNHGAETMYGYTASEVVGQQTNTITMSEYFDTTRLQALKEIQTQGVWKGEVRQRHKNGTALIVMASVSLLHNSVGIPIGFIAVNRDITARKQAEAALQASEARLNGIIESAMDAIISVNAEQRVVLFNKAAEKMFGCPAEQALGGPLARFIPERFRPNHSEHIRNFGQTGVTNRGMGTLGVIYGWRANGEEFPIEASISQIGSADDKLYTVILRDITERKQAEALSQAATTRLQILADTSRTLAEAGTDYLAVLDYVARQTGEMLNCACFVRLLTDDGQWLKLVTCFDTDPESQAFVQTVITNIPWHINANNPYMEIFRQGQPQLKPVMNRNQMRALMPPEHWPMLDHFLDRFTVHNNLWVPLTLQGKPIGMLTLARYRADSPSFIEDDIRLAQDLADRAALAIGNARAIRLKDEFLASMSHELRTPLNSILGRSEALLEKIYGPLTAKQTESLQGIEESGKHLLMLINDILDLSKIESGALTLEVETIAVDMLCTLSLRMITQIAAQKQLKVSTTLDNSVETVRADERRLKQILVNLLSNAVKFTPAGGKIGLEVLGNEEHQTVTFTVWDTGIGINEHDLPRLFKPFVQIDSTLTRQYTGTGLGLALVMRLTEAHQGSIAVESTPGLGSRFSVTIPWRGKTKLRQISPQSDTATVKTDQLAFKQTLVFAPSAFSSHILVVEDNQDNIDILQDYLLSKGYHISVAHNGSEALLQLQEAQPDLIIMDIQMPVMDGLKATKLIRKIEALQNIPIIALTGLAMPGDRERCLEAGASDYMVKPVNLRALLTTLEKCLKQPKMES